MRNLASLPTAFFERKAACEFGIFEVGEAAGKLEGKRFLGCLASRFEKLSEGGFEVAALNELKDDRFVHRRKIYVGKLDAAFQIG